MNKLLLLFQDIQQKLLEDLKNIHFERDITKDINWNESVIGLIGERGVGKTTILLQQLAKNKTGLYFFADNPSFGEQSLFEFIFYLNKEFQIQYFYIDEIHKYTNWTKDIKSIIDSIPGIKIIFSGSSSLDLFQGILDLGRRVSFHHVHTLNFREFLHFFYQEEGSTYSLEEILQDHKKIALKHQNMYGEERFRKFLEYGHYPYAKNLQFASFRQRFHNLLDKIILEDIPLFLNMQTTSLDKVRRVFYFIANTTPSELSFTFLSKKVGVDKTVIENVLTLLHKIGLIHLVPKFGDLSTRVRKEYKILLGNPNLYSAYNLSTDVGILRESFFLSVMKRLENSEIFLPTSGDFIVKTLDKRYIFEVGGKSKSSKQLKQEPNSYIVADNIVLGNGNKIPLWLFGLIK